MPLKNQCMDHVLVQDTLINARQMWKLAGGQSICFAKGETDDYAVVLVEQRSVQNDRGQVVDQPVYYVLSMEDYLTTLAGLASRYGRGKVWEDVYSLYRNTEDFVNDNLIWFLWDMCKKDYRQDVALVFNTFVYLHYVLVSENLTGDKRIGALPSIYGVYMCLLKKDRPSYAARSVRYMRVYDLESQSRGAETGKPVPGLAKPRCLNSVYSRDGFLESGIVRFAGAAEWNAAHPPVVVS